MAADHPGSVFVENIGVTSEGRSIKSLRVSFNSTSQATKPMIVVESGLRARYPLKLNFMFKWNQPNLIFTREWISPMVNLYFIHMLLEHPDYEKLLKKVDFLFVPIANPGSIWRV